MYKGLRRYASLCILWTTSDLWSKLRRGILLREPFGQLSKSCHYEHSMSRDGDRNFPSKVTCKDFQLLGSWGANAPYVKLPKKIAILYLIDSCVWFLVFFNMFSGFPYQYRFSPGTGLGPKQSKIVDDQAKQHLKYHHMLKVYDLTVLKWKVTLISYGLLIPLCFLFCFKSCLKISKWEKTTPQSRVMNLFLLLPWPGPWL